MAIINMRVDENLKKKSEKIFNDLGMNMTTGITIFLTAVVNHKGFPFSLEIPNETTLKSLKEAEDILTGKKKAKRYSSISELRKDLSL